MSRNRERNLACDTFHIERLGVNGSGMVSGTISVGIEKNAIISKFSKYKTKVLKYHHVTARPPTKERYIIIIILQLGMLLSCAAC